MTLATDVRRETAPEIRLDPGSFRDPSGGVIHCGGRILRYYNHHAAEGFHRLSAEGVLRDLEASGLIVGSQPIEPRSDPALYAAVSAETRADVALIVEHPRVPFISYAYDWPFEMLRTAAVHQLDVLEVALERGYTVKDATSYNLQFRGPEPVFIDVASLEPHVEGKPWAGYAQFCRMFLNPLLLQALRGVSYQPWLRHSVEGIDAATLSRLLGLKNKMRPGVFVHVVLQAWLNRRFSAGLTLQRAAARPVPMSATLGLVRGMRKLLVALNQRRDKTTWVDYEAHLPYAAEARAAKERYVEEAVQAVQPAMLWDLGCNQGLYSTIAARHAGYVVAMDFDEAAVGGLYEKVRGSHDNVLPLVMDLMNPDPDQGWAQSERRGLAARGPADFVLGLALVHHLSISGNVPLRKFGEWLSAITHAGIVEFVPKSDPMVQRLLSTRPDVHTDYTAEAFESALSARFRIAERYPLPGSERILYRFIGR